MKNKAEYDRINRVIEEREKKLLKHEQSEIKPHFLFWLPQRTQDLLIINNPTF